MKNSLTWKIYQFLFLDVWNRAFFHGKIRPQQASFAGSAEVEAYLEEMNLKLVVVDELGKTVNLDEKLPTGPILFYANHLSSLDALFVYFALQKFKPWFISFLHNIHHLNFLKGRIIPVAARFAAERFSVLGLKMKLASRLENLSENEAHVMNHEVVELAVKKLAAGQNVVIFPTGGDREWQDGIGFIVAEFYAQTGSKKLTLQPLKTISFHELRSVLHGWLLLLGIKIEAQIKIKAGTAFNLNDLPGSFFAKDKTQKVQAKVIKNWLQKQFELL